MELRHLRHFVAVAEARHFRRAAGRRHVAKPAVSEQVRELEDELGVRLLDRTHRNVALTEAGTALLPEAHRVLRQGEAARLAACSVSDRPGRVLRIGDVPTALLASIPRPLRRVVTTTPNLKTTMEPGPGPELSDALRAAELDVAVVSLPAPTAGQPDAEAMAGLALLAYELLDAHADTGQLADGLANDRSWAAHLDYLRALQRKGRETLARTASGELSSFRCAGLE